MVRYGRAPTTNRLPPSALLKETQQMSCSKSARPMVCTVCRLGANIIALEIDTSGKKYLTEFQTLTCGRSVAAAAWRWSSGWYGMNYMVW